MADDGAFDGGEGVGTPVWVARDGDELVIWSARVRRLIRSKYGFVGWAPVLGSTIRRG